STSQVAPSDVPAFDLSPFYISGALAEANKSRPELRRLNLQKDINVLDVQYFKNQTLPQVDITSTVATTGLAGTPLNPNVPEFLVGGYGKDLSNLFSVKTRNINMGVTISFP